MQTTFHVTFYFTHANPLLKTVRAQSSFDALEKASANLWALGLVPRATIVKPVDERIDAE